MAKPTLLIVSGLQRSGTSLMMQLLNAIDIKANSDNKRKADKSNERGYFEHSNMMKLELDDSFLENGIDKATKVYAAKLQFLPNRFNYKIIFMERNPKEIFISKRVSRGMAMKAFTTQHLNLLEMVIEGAKKIISESKNMEMITVDYKSLVHNPKESLVTIADFIGVNSSQLLEVQDVIDPKLYKNKNEHEFLTIDRSPIGITDFIESHTKGLDFCEIGIGEGDNLAKIKGAKSVLGVESLEYGVMRCKQKYPHLKVIHSSIFDVLDEISFDVCYTWMVYPLNRDLVLAIMEKKPNAKILMGINYYYHLDENSEKYKRYVKSYKKIALAGSWNKYTTELIEEVKTMGYTCELVQIEAENKELFSVGIIEKK